MTVTSPAVVAGTYSNESGVYAPQVLQVYAYATKVVIIFDRPRAPLSTLQGFQVLDGGGTVLGFVDVNHRNITITGLPPATLYTLTLASKLRDGIIGSSLDADMVSSVTGTTNGSDPTIDDLTGFITGIDTAVVVVTPPKTSFQHKKIKQTVTF